MSTLPLFPEERRIELHVTLDWSKQRITFDWFRPKPSMVSAPLSDEEEAENRVTP
jgi:hypothetical protein